MVGLVVGSRTAFGHFLLRVSECALEGLDVVSLGLTDDLLDRAGHGRLDLGGGAVWVRDDQASAADWDGRWRRGCGPRASVGCT